MAGERPLEVRGREGALREEAVDRSGWRIGLEEEDDNRTVYARAVEMDVRLENSGDVVDLQSVMDGASVLVHPEHGAAGGERRTGGRRVARDDLAAAGERRFEPFLPGNDLPADLAARMVRQRVGVDISIATAQVGQELREGMPSQRSDQTGGRDGALGQDPVDFAKGRRGPKQEGYHRPVDPTAVQVDVGLEDARQVENAEAEAERLPIVNELEGRGPRRQGGPGRGRAAGNDCLRSGEVRGEATVFAGVPEYLAANLAARVVRQRMDIDVGITIANIGQEL